MKKKTRDLLIFLLEVILPMVAGWAIHFIELSNGQQVMPWFDGVILGFLFSTTLAIFKLGKDLRPAQEETKDEISALESDFRDLASQLRSIEKIVSVEKSSALNNPYFRRVFDNKYGEFLNENKELLGGSFKTEPYSTNTFGIQGIKTTLSTLDAVSSINDYWDRESFADKYFETQVHLVKKRVKIRRIFIGTKEHLKSYHPIMKKQTEAGIEVYYICSDSVYIPKDWATQDLLIQDGTLLVELRAETHKADSSASEEIITINEHSVREKIDLFNQMLENSEKFSD